MPTEDAVNELFRNVTDIPGFLMGHASDYDALTGCTAVLCPEGAVGGVDVRGASPGTRETDLLRPGCRVELVHGVVLAGGSAFGLDAACGVVRYLEEHGYGYDTGIARVPIVPAAIIFDLHTGNKNVRPDAAMGYNACLAATASKHPEGCVGAGTGATVGNLYGPACATKSGLGAWSLRQGDLIVGAVAVVNALGDVVDPITGEIVAGLRDPRRGIFLNTKKLMAGGEVSRNLAGTNTVLGVVATNASLTKQQVNRVASLACLGLARTISPAHTGYDGDTIFAMARGLTQANPDQVGILAADCVAQAVIRAVREAWSLGGVPAAGDL
ncbi:MAG: P1 family peptidase [Thermacetogeniaceae bacterium]|jgi:L-aminopeptidase/D-esterase-like protein